MHTPSAQSASARYRAGWVSAPAPAGHAPVAGARRRGCSGAVTRLGPAVAATAKATEMGDYQPGQSPRDGSIIYAG